MLSHSGRHCIKLNEEIMATGVLAKANVETIMKTLAGVLRTSYGSNTDGKPVFSLGTLNDMTVEIAGYTGVYPKKFDVRISTAGGTDKIKYRVNNGTWEADANITGSAQTLADGVQVKFAATTGHQLGATWSFVACPAFAGEHLRSYVGSLADVEILYDIIDTVYAFGKRPSNSWSTYKTEAAAIAGAVADNVGSINTFLTDNSALVNAEIRDIVSGLSPVNVIPPVTVLGTFAVTGATTGTWTAVNTIDVSKYGAAKIEVVALSSITDGVTIEGLVGLAFAGTTITKASAVEIGPLDQYEVYDLSSDYTDRFKSISALTISGGVNGEKFMIQTKEDTVPVL
jgi:hypothetical protein